MEIDYILIIGFAAATVTSISALPQLIKIIKTKRTKDLSLLMIFVLLGGIGLWTIYGILDRDWALIFANIIVVIIWGIILGYKLKYK